VGVEILGRFEQAPDAGLVGHPRAVNAGLDHQAFRVHEDVALAPPHLLAPVEAPLLAAHPTGLRRLAVHYSGTRLGIAAELPAQPPPHRPVHPLPGVVDPPCPEVVEHGLLLQAKKV
jgi:hypothetical protein